MNARPSPLALLVAGAFFMEFLDGSIIATALPSMARSLHSSAVALNVGISAYLLTVAVFILPSGWAAQRYGTRRVFAAAVVVFTLGSVLCGISGSAHEFVAFRVLQGLGGAMMVPVGRLAVLRTTPKHQLIGAIAVLTWPGLTAPVLAPPLGGFLTVYASWRWIFFINVPLGILAFLLALRLVPAGRGEARAPFDLLGFALGALACFTVTRLLDLFGENDTGFAQPLLLAAAFAAILGWLLHHLHHHKHPLIDLAPAGIATFAMSLFGGGAMRTVIATMPFLLPLLFQLGFGMDAFHAGLLVIALFAGNIGIKPLTTPIIRRWQFRQIFLANGLFQAATMLGCAMLGPATPVPVILLLLFFSGASRSLQFTSINTLTYADVPERLMSTANTMFSIGYQLTQGFGVALGAVALRFAHLALVGGAGQPGRAEFRLALIGLAVAMVGVSLNALRLKPDAGNVIRLGRPAG
jgi:EmrB/QacA subfamily drug resistance transporter